VNQNKAIEYYPITLTQLGVTTKYMGWRFKKECESPSYWLLMSSSLEQETSLSYSFATIDISSAYEKYTDHQKFSNIENQIL
jgi:hypothetical protein